MYISIVQLFRHRSITQSKFISDPFTPTLSAAFGLAFGRNVVGNEWLIYLWSNLNLWVAHVVAQVLLHKIQRDEVYSISGRSAACPGYCHSVLCSVFTYNHNYLRSLPLASSSRKDLVRSIWCSMHRTPSCPRVRPNAPLDDHQCRLWVRHPQHAQFLRRA